MEVTAAPPLTHVVYEFGGRSFTGYIADGSGGGKVPGIVVVHEGPGLNAHIKERTRMIAALGFVALAADLYGVVDPTIEEAKGFVAALRADLPELRGRMSAALKILAGHASVDASRLAAVGYCFGGTAALELARSGVQLAGVVGFHAGLDTTRRGDARNIRGKVLVCMGADDPIITADKRAEFAAEMTAAGVDWQMRVYGGVGHSFTNRDIDAYGFPGFAYDETADRRSWAAMRTFFREIFG